MSTTYHRIDAAEFEQFISQYDADEVDLDGVKERVFDIETAEPGVVVRVYSTLDARQGGAARDAGADAIRAVVYATGADTVVESATRTHRIDTWDENLAEKVDDLLARAAEGEFEDPLAAFEAHEWDDEPGENGTVYVVDAFRNKYGDLRLALDGDTFDAKDLIKFEWDVTHHSFDSDSKTWVVDAASVPRLAEVLNEGGFALAETPLTTDGFSVRSLLAGSAVARGDRVVVEYEAKNTGSTLTKEGEVRGADDERFTFVRDDGQFMYVDDEGLFTSGSHHPFVGEVVSVAVNPVPA